MKHALLLVLAAMPAWGQTNNILPNSGEAAVAPPVQISSITTNQAMSPGRDVEQVRNTCIQGRRSICGKILQVLPDGLVVESGYTNLLREPLTSSWLVPGTVTASRAANLLEGASPGSICVGTVLLTDLPKSRNKLKPKRYDYVIIEGYPAGQATFTSVGTVQKTVRRFSAQLSRAVAWHLQAESPTPPPAAATK